MKEIIEYLRDMDESVQSIKDNISDLIDIANLPCQQKEVSDLIIRGSSIMISPAKFTPVSAKNYMIIDMIIVILKNTDVFFNFTHITQL